MEENRPDHVEDAAPVVVDGSESIMDKITEKIHGDGSSSSSDSESEKNLPPGKTRLFGRKKPVHTVLGGGKSADIILWRDKQIAPGILVGVTVIWSPPKFPEIVLPEDLFVSIALSLKYEVNRAFTNFREVASGKDLMKFLKLIAIMWTLSVVGSWFNFLTLFYIVYVILHTVPVLYEKHEDHVDTLAEKAMVEINKHYAVLDEKVLQKVPYFSKDKRH
ncbi:Reticulon-like protein b5 [Thalictrum thalictroides]|uniref:Reticulon-like protein n=1 Tax=Thalictrum thalictroides TaxID=46969 RepID=A0A7J6V9I8_THATH|nr:Reticulon-like protein b5 [Thalictrum thalictroides]